MTIYHNDWQDMEEYDDIDSSHEYNNLVQKYRRKAGDFLIRDLRRSHGTVEVHRIREVEAQ